MAALLGTRLNDIDVLAAYGLLDLDHRLAVRLVIDGAAP